MRATKNKIFSTMPILVVMIVLASAAWPQSPLSEEKKKKLSSYDPSDVFPVAREKASEENEKSRPRSASGVAAAKAARSRTTVAHRTQSPVPAPTIPAAASVARTEAIAAQNSPVPAPSVESPAVATMAASPPVPPRESAPVPIVGTATASQSNANTAAELLDSSQSRGKPLSLAVLISLIVIALITLIAMIVKLMKLSARTG